MDATRIADLAAVTGADAAFFQQLLRGHQYDQEALRRTIPAQAFQSSMNYRNERAVGSNAKPTPVLPYKAKIVPVTSQPYSGDRQDLAARSNFLQSVKQQYCQVHSDNSASKPLYFYQGGKLVGSEVTDKYRPPLAPKPAGLRDEKFRDSSGFIISTTGNIKPLLDGYSSSAAFSHTKSDSVDSSDGLRRTSNHIPPPSRESTTRDSGFVEPYGVITGPQIVKRSEAAVTNFGRSNFGSEVLHIGSKPLEVAPEPPPRTYKLVRAVDASGTTTSLLVPHDSTITGPAYVAGTCEVPQRSSNAGRSSGSKNRHRGPHTGINRVAASTPNSRYGSTSSINAPFDFSACDYRVHLQDVRASLGSDDSSASILDPLHLTRDSTASRLSRTHPRDSFRSDDSEICIADFDSFSSTDRCDSQASMRGPSRTASMLSVNYGSPHSLRGNSRTPSSVKNALLKEKLLGPTTRNRPLDNSSIHSKASSRESSSTSPANINSAISQRSCASRKSFRNVNVDRSSPVKVSEVVQSFNDAARAQSEQMTALQRVATSRGQSRSVSRQNSCHKSKEGKDVSASKVNKSLSSVPQQSCGATQMSNDSTQFVRVPPNSVASVREKQPATINRIASPEYVQQLNLENQLRQLQLLHLNVNPSTVIKYSQESYDNVPSKNENVSVIHESGLDQVTQSQSQLSSTAKSKREVIAAPKDDLNCSSDAVDSGLGGSATGSRAASRNGSTSTKATPESESPAVEHRSLSRHQHSPSATVLASQTRGSSVAEPPAAANEVDCSAPFVTGVGSVSRPQSLALPLSSKSEIEKQNTLRESTNNRRCERAPPLQRGMSKTPDNMELVSKARSEVTRELLTHLSHESAQPVKQSKGSSTSFVDTPQHTFMLPDLTVYESGFRTFVERELIEVSTLHSLENSGRLNWWTGPCQRLWPLATIGDGNCLLHAASLGMWGFNDRQLSLRSALHALMRAHGVGSALWRRWRWQTALSNSATDWVLNEDEWREEWDNVLRLASTEPRNNRSSTSSSSEKTSRGQRTLSECLSPDEVLERPSGDAPDDVLNSSRVSGAEEDARVRPDDGGPGEEDELCVQEEAVEQCRESRRGGMRLSSGGDSDTRCSSGSGEGAVYQSLEEFHVFALAHVLRRPIVVVADVMLKDVHGNDLSPIPFGGVYLPVEWPPEHCQRTPLLLTYDAAHFSALVVMEHESSPSNRPAVIPLTTSQHALLPLHFAVDPGEDFQWGQEQQVLESFSLSEEEKQTLLSAYLDLVKVPVTQSFQEHQAYEWQMQQQRSLKSPESSGDSDEVQCTCDESARYSGSHSKSCAKPRQLNPLGSISRSMSKKIKSLGTLRKIGRPGSFRRKGEQKSPSRLSGSFRDQSKAAFAVRRDYILGATLSTDKRAHYQELMVQNYLLKARERYKKSLKTSGSRQPVKSERKPLALWKEEPHMDCSPDTEVPSECINAGCQMFGTAATSYMCLACYTKQMAEEEEMEHNRRKINATDSGNMNSNDSSSPEHVMPNANPDNDSSRKMFDGPQYGAGNSQFYTELDSESATRASSIPSVRPPQSKNDSTLFLSNSVFYNDTKSGNSAVVRQKAKTGVKESVDSYERTPHGVGTSCDEETKASFDEPVTTDGVKQNLCLKEGCVFFGNKIYNGYCSKCAASVN